MNIDQAKKLHQRKYRHSSGHFLIEGEHLLQELERTNIQQAKLYVTERHADYRSRFPMAVISERNMTQLSDTRSPQGMVALVPMSEITQHQRTPPIPERVIYLSEIQDPGNLGTILRTLAWFGGWRCLLSPGSVDPFNTKVVRSSMGAIFHVPIELDVSIDSLTSRFHRIATLDMAGEPLQRCSEGKHDCFIFGNEARGIPQEALAQLSDKQSSLTRYTIPGTGNIESLNLATAVNLCVYELARE